MKPFCILDATRPAKVKHSLCALAVMTKAPQPGRVKTRLIPPLTPDQAAELNRCFLRDTTAAIAAACSHRSPREANQTRLPSQWRPSRSGAATAGASGVAVYTPLGAELVYKDILPADFLLLPQRGDKFGERLYHAAEDLFQCGFGSVCLIDSDSPTVPVANFARAVDLLQNPGDRVVLGPSDDGGYYLIGLKKLHRELFERIAWSTERVFQQSVQRAREIGLDVELLPVGYDVDDAVSLRRLREELLSNQTCNDVAPQTREFLARTDAPQKL